MFKLFLRILASAIVVGFLQGIITWVVDKETQKQKAEQQC